MKILNLEILEIFNFLFQLHFLLQVSMFQQGLIQLMLVGNSTAANQKLNIGLFPLVDKLLKFQAIIHHLKLET